MGMYNRSNIAAGIFTIGTLSYLYIIIFTNEKAKTDMYD